MLGLLRLIHCMEATDWKALGGFGMEKESSEDFSEVYC